MEPAELREGDLIDQSIKTSDEITSGQRTAKKAANHLCSVQKGFVIPTRSQRKNILNAFVRADFVLYGKAFDIVECLEPVNLDDEEDIFEKIDKLVICEIKSTSKASVRPGFKGYFCSISTAEILVAQNLGERYKFVFVNTRTGEYLERSLREVYTNARAIYPSWSVSF